MTQRPCRRPHRRAAETSGETYRKPVRKNSSFVLSHALSSGDGQPAIVDFDGNVLLGVDEKFHIYLIITLRRRSFGTWREELRHPRAETLIGVIT